MVVQILIFITWLSELKLDFWSNYPSRLTQSVLRCESPVSVGAVRHEVNINPVGNDLLNLGANLRLVAVPIVERALAERRCRCSIFLIKTNYNASEVV